MLDFEVDIKSVEVLKNVANALKIIEEELKRLSRVRLVKLEVNYEKVFDVVEYDSNKEKKRLIIPCTVNCLVIFEAEEDLEVKYKKEKEKDPLFWYKFFYLELDEKLTVVNARISDNNVKIDKNKIMIEFFVSPPSNVFKRFH